MQHFRIVQIPSEQNDFTAIVESRTTTASGTFTDFGIATAIIEKTEHSDILLNRAREKSLKRTEKMISSTTTHVEQNGDNNQQSTAQVNPDQPKQYNHSTNKPISEKQTELIIKLTNSQDNADKLANQQYNKHLHALNSKEANDIIQSFYSK